MAVVGDPQSGAGDSAGAERESFEEFYRREYVVVARLAVAMTGRAMLAEELTQDAFLAAYQRWERIGSYDDPAAWVRRVVMNRSISAWRRGAVEFRLLARLRLERAGESRVFAPDEALWDAVRDLPTRQRQVIVLRVVEDRSVEDIARVLDCASDTVRTHLRRARAALARSLSEEES